MRKQFLTHLSQNIILSLQESSRPTALACCRGCYTQQSLGKYFTEMLMKNCMFNFCIVFCSQFVLCCFFLQSMLIDTYSCSPTHAQHDAQTFRNVFIHTVIEGRLGDLCGSFSIWNILQFYDFSKKYCLQSICDTTNTQKKVQLNSYDTNQIS